MISVTAKVVRAGLQKAGMASSLASAPALPSTNPTMLTRIRDVTVISTVILERKQMMPARVMVNAVRRRLSRMSSAAHSKATPACSSANA